MKTQIVTPTGRLRYLEVLYRCLAKQKNSFDTWHLWLNTVNARDISFCKNLERDNDWIKTIDLDVPLSGNDSIASFFKYSTDSDSIYIRFDDDICYLEEKFIEKMTQKRLLDNNTPFLYPIIINNSRIAHVLQNNNRVNLSQNIDKHTVGQNILWKNPLLAMEMHIEFLNKVISGRVEEYYMDDYIIDDYCRTSINCICWFGTTMEKIKTSVHGDEEQFLSVTYPKNNNTPNKILGNVICSHFAYYTQRAFLDNTSLLNEYNKL